MTELRIEPYEIPAADIGPENPLPMFRSAEENGRHNIDPSVPEDERRYIGWQTGSRLLPYRMQDGYTRDKRPKAFKAAVLENEHLRAMVLPELGGRLVSLYHKSSDRELLDRNPVFQPCNLAQRNAWFSGGIEWNTSHFGHYYLTCSPVFAVEVKGIQGEPVLRIYEWDRVQAFPWQIDFHLPPGSEFLFARMRLVNPHDYEIPMYWWTNMAVSERADVRMLCPAESAIRPVRSRGISAMPMPDLDGADCSYTMRVPHSYEVFMRIPKGNRRWVAALDGEGRGFVQTSTDRLIGRKMFCWGNSTGGRRWQEFLAVPGQAYLEIQAGLARTQFEHLPMPAYEQWTWTEAFGLLEADPSEVHHEDWNRAWRTAESALNEKLPRENLDKLHDQFAEVTARQPDRILAEGSGWGALELQRLKSSSNPVRIPAELPFTESTLGSDQRPWLDLLESGTLTETDPQDEIGQFIVQSEWQAILEESISRSKCDHWLAWYHLGNMKMEAHDTLGARQAWETSLQRKRNGWSLRNLAVIALREENIDEACELLRQAWETGPKIAQFAVEYAQTLVKYERYEEAVRFIESIPEDIRQHERVHIAWARASLRCGRYDIAESLLKRRLVTVREGEASLTDLWFEMQERKLAETENIPLDEALKERVRRELIPPADIDFRQ